MNKLKKNYGMTLVSLIVTVIIMLILAGIAISLVVGNNGVLTQASSAIEKTREGTAREEVALAWESIESEYISKHTQDSSISKVEYFTEDNLNKYLEGKGTVTDLSYSETSNSALVYTTEEDNTSYQVIIDSKDVITISGIVETGTSSGTEISGVLASVVTAANYGDTVTYSAGGVEEWKIFYNDGTNVFIIASGYVKNSLVNTSSIGATVIGTYSIYWSDINSFVHSGMDSVDSSVANKYKLNWFTDYVSYTTGTNVNEKATSALLDTSAWSGFVNSDYADSCIGAPTLDMWVASWNSKGYTEITISNGNNGYLVTTNGSTMYFADLSGDATGYADKLYFPYTSAVDNGTANVSHFESLEMAYWIASPNNVSIYNVSDVGCNGYLTTDTYSWGSTGVRPVVCLNSEVKGSYSAGNWSLSK